MMISSGVTGFADRLGGTIVRPRATAALLLRHGVGGLGDLLLLTLLATVAARLPALARAVLFAVEQNALQGLLLVVNIVAQALFLPLVCAFVGGVLLKLASGLSLFGRKAQGGKEEAHVAGAVDLAALCVVPWVFLESVAALLTVWGVGPIPHLVVFAIGGGWGLVLLALTLVTAKKERG